MGQKISSPYLPSDADLPSGRRQGIADWQKPPGKRVQNRFLLHKLERQYPRKGWGEGGIVIVGLTSTNQAGTKIGEKFSGKKGFGGKAAGGAT